MLWSTAILTCCASTDNQSTLQHYSSFYCLAAYLSFDSVMKKKKAKEKLCITQIAVDHQDVHIYVLKI